MAIQRESERNLINKCVTITTTTAFDWSSYCNRSDSLKKLKSNKIHLDTILISSDGHKQAVHWQVMSALCPKLLAHSAIVGGSVRAFNCNRGKNFNSFGPIRRRIEDSIERKLRLPDDIDANHLTALINCAYSGLIQVDRHNLFHLYRISTKYNIIEITDACCTYLMQRLNVTNCIKLFLLGKKHGHPLQFSAWNMIRYNFKLVVCVNQDFHLLPSFYLKSLLMDDHLKIDEDEEFVWTAIVRWFQSRPLTQQEHLLLFANDQQHNNINMGVTGVPSSVISSASAISDSSNSNNNNNNINNNNNLAPPPIMSPSASPSPPRAPPSTPQASGPMELEASLSTSADYLSSQYPFSSIGRQFGSSRKGLKTIRMGNKVLALQRQQQQINLAVASRLGQQQRRSSDEDIDLTADGQYQNQQNRQQRYVNRGSQAFDGQNMRSRNKLMARQNIKIGSSSNIRNTEESDGCVDCYERQNDDADQILLELLKCFRYDKFHCKEIFDCILNHRLIRSNCKATELISRMRQNYLLLNSGNNSQDYSSHNRHHHHYRQNNQSLVASASSLTPSGVVVGRGRRHNRLTLGHYLTRLSTLVSTTGSWWFRRQQQNARSDQDREGEEQTDGAATNSRITRRSPPPITRSRPRIPSSVALLIGGWQHGMASRSIWSYDFVYDCWFKLKLRLPKPRAYHSCQVMEDNLIYVVGGTDGRQYLNTVFCFDLLENLLLFTNSSSPSDWQGSSNLTAKSTTTTKNTGNNGQSISSSNPPSFGQCFIQKAPMSEKRCYLSCVVAVQPAAAGGANKLYALGGHNGQQRLRSAECYSAQLDKWEPIAEMTIARSNASACLHEQKIFIAGGQITDQFIQSSVEFYRHQDNTWTFITPMHVPRMSFALISYKGYLMAIGGCNGVGFTKTVERYNARLSNWSLCSPMLHKRSSFSPIIIEDKLMVVGGYNGFSTMKSCEYFNLIQAQQLRHGPVRWTRKCNLLHSRSGFSVCVLRVMNNAPAYTYHGQSSGHSRIIDLN